MVEPITDDIYLCDNCDAEFIGQKAMKVRISFIINCHFQYRSVLTFLAFTFYQEHETSCYRVERPITPDFEVQPEIKQNQFLEYFKLKSSNPDDESQKSNALFNKGDLQNRTSGRIRATSNLNKCPGIPFSSPLGISIAKKSKTTTEGDERLQEQRLDRIERYLVAAPLSMGVPKWLTKTYDNNRWPVPYKPRRPNEYVRKYYNFGNYSGKPGK